MRRGRWKWRFEDWILGVADWVDRKARQQKRMVEVGKAVRAGQGVFTEEEVIDMLDVAVDSCENIGERLQWCCVCNRRHQGRRVELGRIVQNYVEEQQESQ